MLDQLANDDLPETNFGKILHAIFFTHSLGPRVGLSPDGYYSLTHKLDTLRCILSFLILVQNLPFLRQKLNMTEKKKKKSSQGCICSIRLISWLWKREKKGRKKRRKKKKRERKETVGGNSSAYQRNNNNNKKDSQHKTFQNVFR